MENGEWRIAVRRTAPHKTIAHCANPQFSIFNSQFSIFPVHTINESEM